MHDGHAHAVSGGADDPAVTLRTTIPLFMRMAAGEVNPAKAIMDGDLHVEGDFSLAARLGEMFGESSPW